MSSPDKTTASFSLSSGSTAIGNHLHRSSTFKVGYSRNVDRFASCLARPCRPCTAQEAGSARSIVPFGRIRAAAVESVRTAVQRDGCCGCSTFSPVCGQHVALKRKFERGRGLPCPLSAVIGCLPCARGSTRDEMSAFRRTVCGRIEIVLRPPQYSSTHKLAKKSWCIC